jgi:hypothetical protein
MNNLMGKSNSYNGMIQPMGNAMMNTEHWWDTVGMQEELLRNCGVKLNGYQHSGHHLTSTLSKERVKTTSSIP